MSKVEELEGKINKAREIVKPLRQFTPVGNGVVKEFTMYHSSKSRHSALLMTLDDGTEVIKNVKESDFLTVINTFKSAEEIVVWYDANKIVQQFCLSFKK